VTTATSLAAAEQLVRKGTDDVAVQQQGNRLTVRYSAADPTLSGVVNSLFSSIVAQANIAATGRAPTYQMSSLQVEDASLKPIQYLAPGLLGWAIASGGAFAAAATLVN